MNEFNDIDEYDPVKDTIEWDAKLSGKSYTFDDGDKIEVVQVRRRDDGPWVTYYVYQGPGIPRKLMMTVKEFYDTYGHLFGFTDSED